MPDVDKLERPRSAVRPPGWQFGTPDITTDWRLRHAC